MSEEIISQRIVSSKVLGSANPISRGFRQFKSKITGFLAAPILFLIGIIALISSENIDRNSKIVEKLDLKQVSEVENKEGVYKFEGKAESSAPIKNDFTGDVLYLSYKKEQYKKVEKVEKETVTEVENGKDVEKVIETKKLVDEWVELESSEKWADIKIGSISVLAGKAKPYLELESKTLYLKSSNLMGDSNKTKCNELGGDFIDNFNECENITEDDCKKLNGDFDVCASSCRNIQDPSISCIQVCVQVCKMKETSGNKFEEIDSSLSIVPQIGDQKITYQYLKNNSNLIVIGEIRGNQVKDGKPFIVANISDTELVNKMKGEENFLYWFLKVISVLFLCLGFSSLISPILAFTDLIPIAGKAVSCVGFVISLILSVMIVVLVTLLIKFWLMFIVGGVLLFIILIAVLIFVKRKRNEKK